MLIFTIPSTLLAGALCNSLWGLGSSLRLVLFSFASLFVAYSFAKLYCLENCHLALVILHLPSCKLSSCIQPVVCASFLQQWLVRYGLITLGTNLVLRDFHQVRARFARLTSDEVNSKVLVIHASSCITLRILSF